MTSSQFTAAVLLKLKRSWIWILAITLLGGLLLLFYALQKPVTYTSQATLFPLNSTTESSTSSLLSSLMGIHESAKSFSNEASINIVELAESRAIRMAVAAQTVPEKGNKTIAQLLWEERNEHKGLLEGREIKPATQEEMIFWAAVQMENNLDAGINKNSSFELKYTGRSPELVRLISYGFIDKISSFYIDLKREKARLDYDFATAKVDSLNRVMSWQDQKLISLQKRTMFTDAGRLEYQMPAENLLADKQLLRNQYATAVTNQQNASYILQKATPVIKLLDKPDAPYRVNKRYPLLFLILGLMVGFALATGISVSGVFMTYIREDLAARMRRK